jgi:tRNA(Ile)-lysidine synthase
LLRLLHGQHAQIAGVIHLDHATRPDSATDAAFVAEVATQLRLPLHRERIDSAGEQTEAELRRARLGTYRRGLSALGADAVAVAHHADDVAETIAMRLLRGSPRSGTLGLAPLREEAIVANVPIVRPLLRLRRRQLREYLEELGQPHREDPTNAMPTTLRNRVRQMLAGVEVLHEALVELADAAMAAERELDEATWDDLDQPTPLARRAARRRLVAAGLPEAAAGPDAVDRLLAVADPAGPVAASFGGGVEARRSRRVVRFLQHPPQPSADVRKT